LEDKNFLQNCSFGISVKAPNALKSVDAELKSALAFPPPERFQFYCKNRENLRRNTVWVQNAAAVSNAASMTAGGVTVDQEAPETHIFVVSDSCD
jgi:hypothetical protein